MKRVLFITMCSALGLSAIFAGFPWLQNRFASDIATEEVAVMPDKWNEEFGYPLDLHLTEEEKEWFAVWGCGLD